MLVHKMCHPFQIVKLSRFVSPEILRLSLENDRWTALRLQICEFFIAWRGAIRRSLAQKRFLLA